MPAIGHQIEVIGEAHYFSQALENINTEAFAAVLHGLNALRNDAVIEKKRKRNRKRPLTKRNDVKEPSKKKRNEHLRLELGALSAATNAQKLNIIMLYILYR